MREQFEKFVDDLKVSGFIFGLSYLIGLVIGGFIFGIATPFITIWLIYGL